VSALNRRDSIRGIILVSVFVLAMPLLPMVISGEWKWWQAWTVAALFVGSFTISRLIMARRHPDLLAERARFLAQPGTKPWDKVLAPLLGIGSMFLLLVPGLDRRFGWTGAFLPAWHIAGLVLMAVGYGISSWAPVVNRFFSGTVRLQPERGQTVVSDGPYRFVRHPGYAGAVLGYLGLPLLLNSAWAFVPAALLTLVIVFRTALEDQMLQSELAGYAEYARRTPYRLVPGIW